MTTSLSQLLRQDKVPAAQLSDCLAASRNWQLLTKTALREVWHNTRSNQLLICHYGETYSGGSLKEIRLIASR